ncbi:MAG: hypothetical protein WCL27_06920 [Betaproteobacteria bacterium]
MNRAKSDERDPNVITKMYGANAIPITIALAEYHLNHMRRLYKAFGGDLLLPMILGEVGHVNLRGVNVLAADIPKNLEAIRVLAASRKECNAYSISLALGLPRETVRRKVAKLIDLGFLQHIDRRSLRITDKAILEFVPEFNLESLRLFLATSDRITGILAQSKS